jgi:hypothetical protein
MSLRTLETLRFRLAVFSAAILLTICMIPPGLAEVMPASSHPDSDSEDPGPIPESPIFPENLPPNSMPENASTQGTAGRNQTTTEEQAFDNSSYHHQSHLPLIPKALHAWDVEGYARFRESGVVADPFCNITSAGLIDESRDSESARCPSASTYPDSSDRDHQVDGCRQSGRAESEVYGNNEHSSQPEAHTKATFTAVFSSPAHFSHSHVRLNSPTTLLPSVSQRSPIMIYDGMTVSIEKSGRYEVRAVIDGPRVPAILRLQLTFNRDGSDVAAVTLAPIRLIPRETVSTDLPNETQTWFVRRTGFSVALADLVATRESDSAIYVRRSGTSQSGQIPAAR